MFETKRLRIRNFKMDDAQKCYESWGQDKNLRRYILIYPMTELSQMESFVRGLMENENAWLLEEIETGNVVGYVTVDIPYDILKIGEVGYVIAEKYHRKGYAYEALSGIVRKYFDERDLYLIEAKYNENNIASENLLNKLGFKVDACLRERRMDGITGERNNLIVCSLKKEEFIR